MVPELNFPGADRSQWAGNSYPGDAITPNAVVLHTTETRGWPSYSNGYWPQLTYQYGHGWRQHLPLTRSGRALENHPGGVETNTLNVVQVELVGTCDPSYHRKYGGLFWPDPPDGAVEELAAFLAFMHAEWGVHLSAPSQWPAYPASYGNRQGQRMSAAAWLGFYGVCGHMHVPENHHGDPGDIPIGRLLALAGGGRDPIQEENDMQISDHLKIGQWVKDRWPSDKGIQDGISVQTALSSGYAHARVAHQNTQQILAQLAAQEATIDKLADALSASPADLDGLKAEIHQAVSAAVESVEARLVVPEQEQ